MDIADATTRQKSGKSPGPHCIQMDAYVYGGHRLNVYLLFKGIIQFVFD